MYVESVSPKIRLLFLCSVYKIQQTTETQEHNQYTRTVTTVAYALELLTVV